MKKARWNPAAVIAAAKRGERKALEKCGVMVKQYAERSIRTTKNKSAPEGRAPYQRPASVYRPKFSKTIRWELTKDNVIIGSVSDKYSKTPKVLEHGGASTFTLGGLLDSVSKQRARQIRKRYKIKGLSKSLYLKELDKKRPHVYGARPFMRPALNKLLNQLPKEFRW